MKYAIITLALASFAAQAQDGPWVEYQKAPIRSADKKLTYTPVVSSLKVVDGVPSLLWLVAEQGHKPERYRLRITGCGYGGGEIAFSDASGERIHGGVRDEWTAEGPAILDGIARRTCVVSGVQP